MSLGNLLAMIARAEVERRKAAWLAALHDAAVGQVRAERLHSEYVTAAEAVRRGSQPPRKRGQWAGRE